MHKLRVLLARSQYLYTKAIQHDPKDSENMLWASMGHQLGFEFVHSSRRRDGFPENWPSHFAPRGLC
jgi:hypothetical protein